MSRRLIVSTALGIAGLAVAALVDWRIALAVFLMLWGHNMERHR